MLLLTMSLSAHSEPRVICIICIGVDNGPPAYAPGSWCKKWTKKRRAALTFTDAQIGTLDRNQREAFKSIKRDIRRCK
jgi:hypothetical protein